MTASDAVSAAAEYVKGRYSGSRPRPYADGASLPVLPPAQRLPAIQPGEVVCTYCERGQCARCRDRACTCCYGNED